VKVLAIDHTRPGVTLETLQPLLPNEAAHAWKLWKEGILRENYARMDVTGVVIVFEARDAVAVRALLAEFPMTKAGFIEWDVIPLGAPLPLEALMRDDVVASTQT
jgi:muconolactone delta-isomerase